MVNEKYQLSEDDEELFLILNKKYRLLEHDAIQVDGNTLYRIQAVRSFMHPRMGSIPQGSLGGYVASENNLSQNDVSWISGDAKVYGYARVEEFGLVKDQAVVRDLASVIGNAVVLGSATVSGYAQIADHASVMDHAQISEEATVKGSSVVSEEARVSGNAEVNNSSVAHGSVIAGNAVFKDSEAAYNAVVDGNAYVKGSVVQGRVTGYAKLVDNTILSQHHVTAESINDPTVISIKSVETIDVNALKDSLNDLTANDLQQ